MPISNSRLRWRANVNMHRYTPEQVEYIRQTLPGRSHVELTKLVNAHFGTRLSVGQITGAAKNRKIRNGRDCRFQPGQISHKKGRKGISYPGSEVTQFKPGQTPPNQRPVGSERINVDGYIEIKIADPKKWRAKHVVVWEAANGQVPPGHVLIFGDGNKRNLNLENLILVTRAQLAVMNKAGLVGIRADLTRVGATAADLIMAITQKQKEAKQ